MTMYDKSLRRSNNEVVMYFLHKDNMTNFEPSKIEKGLDICALLGIMSFNFNITPWKSAW